MHVARHVDWLSVTVGSRNDVTSILPLAEFAHIGVGHHGYRIAFEDRASGARVETDSPIEGMDTHLTLSGQTLETVRAWYADGDDGLLAAVRAVSGRASRVDLALNIHGGQLTVRDFYSAYKSGALKTTTRRAYHVEGIGDGRDGETMYFGSPKSDRQCRIYDKAAEQAIVDGESWLRLELALRDLRAKSALAATTDNRVSGVVSAHVAAVFNWNQPEYLSSLGDDLADIQPIKRKQPATERWLIEQCAPALARVYAVKPEFMIEFMASFGKSLDRLKSGD